MFTFFTFVDALVHELTMNNTCLYAIN